MTYEISVVKNGLESSRLAVSEQVFGKEYNQPLVHQVAVAYSAYARSGTKAQKTRAEVRGGGIKPWKQKGSGRARAGSSRSPIWRTGGVTFASELRSYKQKVNRKMYRAAVRSILSELLRQNRIVIAEDLISTSHKTSELVKKLKNIGGRNIYIMDSGNDENLFLASRNIPNVEVGTIDSFSVPALINCDKLILSIEAVGKIEERLK